MLGTAENLLLADPSPEIYVEDSTNKYIILYYYYYYYYTKSLRFLG
jgi:hypothetical protein